VNCRRANHPSEKKEPEINSVSTPSIRAAEHDVINQSARALSGVPCPHSLVIRVTQAASARAVSSALSTARTDCVIQADEIEVPDSDASVRCCTVSGCDRSTSNPMKHIADRDDHIVKTYLA